MAKKYVDGVLMDTTEEENAQIKIDADNYKKRLSDYETEKTNTANKKTSGKAKLKAGQALTDDEITALFGA
jgi:regulator of replication initiation timing